MNIAKIPFRGITRNTDDGLCQDGECMELINARIANNSVEPVSTPILKATFADQYTKVYYHAIAEKYIAIKADKTLVSISKDLTTVTTLSTSLTDAIGIEFMGNIVCVLTESGLRYMRWMEGAYKYIGDVPELPEISIGYKTLVQTVTYENLPRYVDILEDHNKVKDLNELMYGLWLNAISKLNQIGYFEHSTCIRIAFRLFDGSYIKHSPIRYLAPYGTVKTGNSSVPSLSFGLFTDENKFYTRDSTNISTFLSVGFKPTFDFNSFDLSAWKDIILSIDIFATRGMRNKYNGYYHLRDDVRGWEAQHNLKQSIEEASEFYKIASISLDGKIDYPEQNVSVDSISLNEQLSDDNLTHVNNYIKKTYVYNSRLHIFGISSSAFSGYEKDYIYDTGVKSSVSGIIDVYVYITTSFGQTIVHKQFTNIILPSSITPFLMYPDSRASKMVIRITQGTTIHIKEFELKAHSKLNLSYHIEGNKHTSYDGSSYNRPELESDVDYDIIADDISNWSTTDISITPNVIIEPSNQKLKVSSLNNPFSFPARTTYQFQSDIIDIRSNTTALSQGQFGQFPLYVFCKDGVHAMQVGTEVVYSTSVPVSRDVCIGQTCGIDSAVIFPTDRGLMMISGTQCQCISEAMEGWLPSCVISSPLIPKIMGVGGMSNMLSSVVFNDYIKGANIGYNYQQSEIIVANSTYPYSYVFSMKSQSWYKIDMSINSFVNVYPETYAIVLKNIYDLNNNHRSVSRIALLSRPIKFGSTAHKRVLQSALRGIIKRALSDLYLRGEQVQYRGEDLTIFKNVGFYMLGSNDAEHYELVNGKESITDLRDLVTKMNKSKPYKYFMLCIVGGVRSDVSINYIELMVDESFNNRLR